MPLELIGEVVLDIYRDFGESVGGLLRMSVSKLDDEIDVVMALTYSDGISFSYSSASDRRSSAEFYWDEDPEFCLKDLFKGVHDSCRILQAGLFQHGSNFMQSSIDWLGIHILFSLSMPEKLTGWAQLIILDYLEIPNANIFHCQYRIEDGVRFADELRALSIKSFGAHTG